MKRIKTAYESQSSGKIKLALGIRDVTFEFRLKIHRYNYSEAIRSDLTDRCLLHRSDLNSRFGCVFKMKARVLFKLKIYSDQYKYV